MAQPSSYLRASEYISLVNDLTKATKQKKKINKKKKFRMKWYNDIAPIPGKCTDNCLRNNGNITW